MDKGEVQGVWLPKKPRRRAEGSEAQWEGQSLKGVANVAHYSGVVEKTLPTVPQTTPTHGICHKRRILNTSTPRTCWVRVLNIYG